MRKFIVSMVLLVVPAAASAQVCPYGLVAVDPAHCCWPGQTFAADRGTCAGVPQCPAGLAPYGETCVVSQQAPAQPPVAQPAPLPPAPDAQPLPPPPPMPVGGYTAMPAQALGFQVHFEAKHDGEDYTVTLDKGGVACRVPCDMSVPPGRHRVKVEGDAKFHTDLNFPAGPVTVVIQKRKGGLAALGIVSLAVGIPAAAIGAVVGLVGLAATNTSVYSPGSSTYQSGKTLLYGGFGVAAAGVTLAAVGAGVGFGLAGKNRASFARVSNKDESSLDEAPPIQLLGLGVAPTNGGAMAGATFAF